MIKTRAPRNRTLEVSKAEKARLLRQVKPDLKAGATLTGVVHGDYNKLISKLPAAQVDLLFLDPPYNLTKSFNGRKFVRTGIDEYTDWLYKLFSSFKPLLKETATIYICGDWLSSQSIFTAASKHFKVKNRITWEREKGRGAKSNWKNSSEDVWFCTMSDNYTFNVDDVKLRRRVLAPYTLKNGTPKDWEKKDGAAFRDTYPSNLWTDITIPFWSMPENTDHPTQKSEKFMAKLILASSNKDDLILDPFLGSGTTCAVAAKLERRSIGIEIDEEFALLAAKRLEQAKMDRSIQGFEGGVFWERNSLGKAKQLKE